MNRKRMEEIAAEQGLTESDTNIAIDMLKQWCQESGFDLDEVIPPQDSKDMTMINPSEQMIAV